MMEMIKVGMDKCFTTPFALGWSFFLSSIVGPHINNFHHWLPKIKKQFDPNNTSDPMGYAEPEN
jgi:hypothetical protein